jgi:hypothetical protein
MQLFESTYPTFLRFAPTQITLPLSQVRAASRRRDALQRRQLRAPLTLRKGTHWRCRWFTSSAMPALLTTPNCTKWVGEGIWNTHQHSQPLYSGSPSIIVVVPPVSHGPASQRSEPTGGGQPQGCRLWSHHQYDWMDRRAWLRAEPLCRGNTQGKELGESCYLLSKLGRKGITPSAFCLQADVVLVMEQDRLFNQVSKQLQV